jgi:hypothetical protein
LKRYWGVIELTKSKSGKQLPRRDFLASVGAGAIMASLPWAPKSAFAASGNQAAPAGAKIAQVRIYPAIGICRVGGSDKYFLAPEIPGLPPEPSLGYKDASSFKDGDEKLKKQAQRFRVYSYDDAGRVIGEVTDGGATIQWRVHLANTKAAWYGFSNPLDNGPVAPGIPGKKRNQFFVDNKKREDMLVIDGGERVISGKSENEQGKDSKYGFKGQFWQTVDVELGELRTDSNGRLLVIPPDGISKSPNGAGLTSFADNDEWHDDWCDGPVNATVTLADGRELKAEPSWVACVGPNFAPEIPPITTMYDVVENMNVDMKWSNRPDGPLSFRKYIYPTLRRVAQMEWLTDAARLRMGWMDIGDFGDPRFVEKLADPSSANSALRKKVFDQFRNPHNMSPDAYKEERLKIPYMVGDGVNYDGSPLQWFQFPKLQYWYLEQWRDGNFNNDLNDTAADNVLRIEQLPIQDQPAALTEAALEPLSGGGFHPGVELTYYLRIPGMFARNYDQASEPFRLPHGDRPSLIHDLGLLLTDDIALKGTATSKSPIGPQSPGDLTRWMGLPWQCDAFSCQQVLLQENFPTAVWWPALLPIDVLPEAHYDQVMREDLSSDNRVKFFNNRVRWVREISGVGYHANASYWDGLLNMIELWERCGFVVKRPGPKDPSRPKGLPKEMYVEVGRAETMEKRYNWKKRDGQLP